MLKINSYLLASYNAFLILSDVDNEIHESEIQVINKFIDQFHTSKYFDRDEEYSNLMIHSREERKLMFKDYVEYIANNANSTFKNKFYSFSIELISADKIVKNSELELFFQLRDILGIKDNKYIFAAPKEIDKLVKEAINFSFNINQSLKYSHLCYANVEMKFASKNGILIHRISFDNSKTNYSSASNLLRKKMDKIRFLARAISFEMIKCGVLGNRKEILDCRFTFKNEDIDYFVIADLYRNKVILTYVGCSDWDYHIL